MNLTHFNDIFLNGVLQIFTMTFCTNSSISTIGAICLAHHVFLILLA
jgi:hypothetical protein